MAKTQAELAKEAGELGEQVVQDYCDEVVITLKAAIKGLKTATTHFTEIVSLHDVNIPVNDINITEDSVSINLKFSIDEEKLKKQKRWDAIRKYMEN